MHAVRPDSNEPATGLAPSFAIVTDLEAIDEVLRGNREMFEVIVRRYNPRLYRIGMAYLRSQVEAEDAMQNAYVRAFFHLSAFQRTAAFSTWLTRIMINECLTVIRRNKTRLDEPLDSAVEPGDAPAGARAPDEIQINEMKVLLETAITHLPQTYRAVYMLREVQQLSTAETAESLGISEESAKVILHRARARVKEHLSKSAAAIELFPYPAKFCNPMTERVLRIVLRGATGKR